MPQSAAVTQLGGGLGMPLLLPEGVGPREVVELHGAPIRVAAEPANWPVLGQVDRQLAIWRAVDHRLNHVYQHHLRVRVVEGSCHLTR